MSSRIVIQPKVPRDIYFQFKQLCQALDIPVERAIAGLMQEALDRAADRGREQK